MANCRLPGGKVLGRADIYKLFSDAEQDLLRAWVDSAAHSGRAFDAVVPLRSLYEAVLHKHERVELNASLNALERDGYLVSSLREGGYIVTLTPYGSAFLQAFFG